MLYNDVLQRFNYPLINLDLSVLVLVGWTGTGKTLTSNLVAASFPIPGNIHRIAGSSLSQPHTLVQVCLFLYVSYLNIFINKLDNFF